MSTQTEVMRPTGEPERLLALDAARGLAILGVFCVNVQLMGLPIAELFSYEPPKDASTLDLAAWAFTKVFCENKFYPLFSMLFGMGFILLIDRAKRSGARPALLYLRRIGVLFVFGALHVSLLWYGDILLIYSVFAIALLLARRLSARRLAMLAGGFLALAVFSGYVGTQIMPAPAQAGEAAGTPERGEAQGGDGANAVDHESEPAASDESNAGASQGSGNAPSARFVVDPDRSPSMQFIESLEGDGAVMEDAHAWATLETMATRDGPFSEAMTFRVMHYAMFMAFGIPFGFGASVLAMFFLGAAIMRGGLLHSRRFLLSALAVGMAFGLPASGGLVLMMSRGDPGLTAIGATLNLAIAPTVSLMYLSAITLLANSSVTFLPRILAPVGRMALTNYLTHSLVLAILMQHWGLQRFNTFSRAELLATVFGVFAAQIVLSHLWLRVFRFGPMEWLWRSLTYLRPQAMLRRGGVREA